MGALFGILYAIGAPVPKPGSISFIVGMLFTRVKNFISGEEGRCHGLAVSRAHFFESPSIVRRAQHAMLIVWVFV